MPVKLHLVKLLIFHGLKWQKLRVSTVSQGCQVFRTFGQIDLRIRSESATYS
jgi:hypothetical protein